MNNSPLKISCIIITKNEERNIGRCIESLNSVADEIIVIDSYSTDRTEEICAQFNIRFVKSEWKGYSETKNYGNSLASHEYILSLDADEALSEELRTEIKLLKNNNSIADAYFLNRLTNYCGKWIWHCGWYPDKKLRLWNRNKGKWQGRIHESVIMEEYSISGKLKGNIHHYSYYTINEHIAQMMHFTDLMAETLVNKRKKHFLFNLLVSPVIKFIVSFFIKAGFRDGYYGFIICVLSSVATFLKYAKAYQLLRSAKQAGSD